MTANEDKLENFLNGIGAVRLLLQRAHEHGFLIEAQVLYATLIDGFCRIALVLTEQIETKSSEFDSKYLYQDDDDEFYTERQVYDLAREKRILDEDLHEEIDALYDFRNKVIHRFIISEIEYGHLGLILDRYELAFHRMYNIVYELESQQIVQEVGMTRPGPAPSDDDKRAIEKGVLSKIASGDKHRLTKTLGSRLVTEPAKFSEVYERQKIAEEIADELEIREEKSRIPPGFASVKEITKWAERKGLFEKCSCGHEKIMHINIDNERDGNKNLNEMAKKCQIKSCGCSIYNTKS